MVKSKELSDKEKYVLECEKKYSWVRYIRNRVLKKNKNFIVALTGATGSGKSWSSLSIGEMIDPNFTEERVIFKGSKFMELLNVDGESVLNSGAVIVWDEAGVDLSSKNWYSTINKLLNLVMQTFRHRNIVLIFTVPYGDFVDSSTRKLFHAEFKTIKINTVKRACEIKPKLLQYNSELRKWYAKYLIAKNELGFIKIKKWSIPKPHDDLIERYEEKKRAFTMELNNKVQRTLLKLDSVDYLRLTERQRKILELWKQGVGRTDEIARRLETTPPVISKNIGYMKRKGFFRDSYVKGYEFVNNLPN